MRGPIAQKLESTMHRVNYHPVSSREMNWAIYLMLLFCTWHHVTCVGDQDEKIISLPRELNAIFF